MSGLARPRSLLLVAAVVAMSLAPFARGADDCRATLPGANVAGGEFNGGKQPAGYAWDTIFPAAGEIALTQTLGLRLMRVPFLWERLQPAAQGPLDEAELGRLDAVVALAAAARITVALDAHNYGSYRGRSLARDDASTALPDLWKRLAHHFVATPISCSV